MNPIAVALKGKGLSKLLQRWTRITRRYGLTHAKMDRALSQFAEILGQFGYSATFPITSVALQRNPRTIHKYLDQGIEFAVHGYRHIDHSQLSQAQQLAQLTQAIQVFHNAGLRPQGFRSPYLRWNADTIAALRQCDFAYDGSQGLAWDVVGGLETASYRHALSFYGAQSANSYPSVPQLDNGLVRIPYSLPDDEALVERLALEKAEQGAALWLAILDHTYQLGELFALGLHPERIAACQEPLAAVLAKARSLQPAVWIARLDEIATWWRERSRANVQISNTGDGVWRLTVSGPPGTTILSHDCQVEAQLEPWTNGYHKVNATEFTVKAHHRPFIGLSPGTPPGLADFLQQQGYVVEPGAARHHNALYIDHTEFSREHERSLLDQIEETKGPLVRLGRWPNGAQSALVITGDIDALTLWDYGWRIFGR